MSLTLIIKSGCIITFSILNFNYHINFENIPSIVSDYGIKYDKSSISIFDQKVKKEEDAYEFIDRILE